MRDELTELRFLKDKAFNSPEQSSFRDLLEKVQRMESRHEDTERKLQVVRSLAVLWIVAVCSIFVAVGCRLQSLHHRRSLSQNVRQVG